MALLKTISLVFVALCLSSSHDVKAAKDFDFYYLVLMWPASYCFQSRAGCCLPTTGAPALDFFISGLWTYSNTTLQPVTKCNKMAFDLNQVKGLKYDLFQYWTNIKCPSTNGVGLWRSAWTTYGVCSGLSEHDYFHTALELRNKIHLLATLAQNGIVPTTNYLYKVNEIKKTIEENLGATVTIQCSKNKSGQLQLYRIYVCINKDGSTIVSCPANHKYTCGDEVSFAPFTYNMLKLDSNTDVMIKMYTHDGDE